MSETKIYVTEDELSPVAFSGDFNDLINVPSINDATESFGPEEFQQAMLQYFDVVGDKDATMKPYAQKMRNSILNLEEFGKLGSGLFIHWGIYSVPAGVYTGTKQPGATVTATTTNYNAEWAMRDLGIPKDVYKAYENQFTGENFDADAICQMAVDLGMKYIIITTKHHEGFCLAPTENNTGWDIRTAACRNTIIDELVEACKTHKLKLGFYYSQYWDWMAEGGFGLNKNRNGQWSTTDLYTTAQHTEYCKKAIAQINELIEKYNPYILWYDPGENVGTTYRDMFRAAEKEQYINIITNDRLGYSREYGDYGTGERTIYLRTLPYGESCFTLNNTWGYSTNNETNSIYYSLETLLKQFMLYTISYGQNCVLNVGPKPDGSLPDLTNTRLTQLKNFITTYANGGFYDYKRVNTKVRPKWGYMIQQPTNKIMCYVAMPSNQNYQNVILDGVDTTLLKTDGVHILTPGTNASYTILDEQRIQINNLALDSNSKIGVVELEYTNEPPKLDYVTAQNHELITSRVFPVNAATYDFSKCVHYGNQSNTFNLTTRVKWIDETKQCGISLNYTYNTDNRSVTTTITVTDEEDSTKTQTFTYGENDTVLATRFNFEEGHIYTITYHAAGSIAEKFYFNGFTIEKNDVEHVTGVTVTPTSIDLPKGGTTQLTCSVTPAYADDTSVSWESDNTDIATVSSAGFVTAGQQSGTANITVTTTDGSYAATCAVTVKDIAVTGVELDADAINMYQAETRELHYTVTPENAGNKLVSWSSSRADVHVDNGVVSIEPEATGTATITITTDDGSFTDTCTITIVPETYDYIFRADSLDGSDTQGEDTGITLFDDEKTNWTILSYVQNSVNAGQADNNATLYQIVVNASPWSGMRVDADNNNYPRTSATYSPLIPRFVAQTDVYVNPITGVGQSGKPNVNPTGMMHPICFSRNGDTYKYSIDGVNWTEITGVSASQIARLKTCPLTVGFDYRRSSGTMTTTKYRKLITNDPCCVAIKYESEYPFWKLYNQYDEGRTLGEVVE